MINSDLSNAKLDSMRAADLHLRSVADLRSANKATIGQLLLSLTVGGGEVLAARIARRLSDRYRFVFFCLDELGALGEDLKAEGFCVHILHRRAGLDGRCAQRLYGLLRRERVAVLHAHQYTPFFYGAVSRRLGRRPPIVFTEHGRTYPDYRRWKRVLANRVLLARRDRVVGVGEAVRRALIDNEGLSRDRVEVVYNGIDLAPYASERRVVREDARRELRCGPEHLVILQVARLDPLKDHLTAIRAFERTRHQRADARLVLVGEGPERPLIESEIASRNLGPSVHLLGLRKDVPRWLAAADVFWLSSISEGIPLTLIEAMAARVPVAATNVGGVSEVIESERTGLLVPAGDDQALSAAAMRLATDESLSGRLIDAARQRAFDHFSEVRMHESYARIYEELLRG